MVQKIEIGNFDEYLKEIEKFPLLDQEEEKKLQNAGEREENKQTLYNSNLKLVVSIAKKLHGYGVSIEDLVRVGNEELLRAIDGYNRFSEKSDLMPSSYYIWGIRLGMAREIIKKRFSVFTSAIPTALEEKDFDRYYAYFFLEHVLIHLITYKENGSKDALEILGTALTSTFSDPDVKQRISDKNFIRTIPEFAEMLKAASPETYKELV